MAVSGAACVWGTFPSPGTRPCAIRHMTNNGDADGSDVES